MVDEQRWAARPWSARAVKVAAVITPVVVSALVCLWIDSRVARPTTFRAAAVWWLVLSAIATLVVAVVDRLSRRLLPLSALFGLSLVFPDRAPSRFRTALRSGTVVQLRRRIEQARTEGLGDDAGEAARRLVELAGALSVHDRLTRGHSERVRAYTKLIAEELHLTEREIDRLQWAGLAHDVGKLFVDPAILNKPGKLTDEEYEAIKAHAGYGAELVVPLASWLGDAVQGVGEHHERWDGKGYPSGLAGHEISQAGRMIAVADVFDVITSVRSYKKAQAVTAAREELVRCSGTQFDPKMVRAFLNIGLGRLRLLVGPLSWVAQLPVAGRIPVGGALAPIAGGAAAAVAVLIGGVAGVSAPADVGRELASPVVTSPDGEPAAVVVPQEGSADPPAGTGTDTESSGDPRTVLEPPSDEPTATDQPVRRRPPSTGEPPDGGTPPGTRGTPPPTSPPTEPGVPSPPPPPGNAPPVANADSFSLLEDAGSTALDVLANDVDSNIDPTTVAVVSAPSRGSAAASPGGRITYRPSPDTNGVDGFTYRVCDLDGVCATAAVSVSVVAVNDAPSFRSGPSLVVTLLDRSRSIPGWASDIRMGPANESAQRASFAVTNNRSSMFRRQPAIDANGGLTFEVAPLALGLVTVTVVMTDDGGTANGGVDATSAVTFTILVLPS